MDEFQPKPWLTGPRTVESICERILTVPGPRRRPAPISALLVSSHQGLSVSASMMAFG